MTPSLISSLSTNLDSALCCEALIVQAMMRPSAACIGQLQICNDKYMSEAYADSKRLGVLGYKPILVFTYGKAKV